MAVTTVVAVAVLAAAIICVACYYRRKERKLLGSINAMLDCAIDGTFTEGLFDESVLSLTETKLNGFLSQTSASSRNLSEEKEKLKELISDISHQTKTPIANILLYSQLLCEKDLSDEEKSCAAAASQQAEKLSFLINALVKTSRLETGIVTLNPCAAEVDDMLAAVKEQVAIKAEAKNISLDFVQSGQKACFDAKWTAEAVFNIVDNAVKYTAPGGFVKVSVTPYQMFCRIDIEDNGAGISEEEQAKIFLRFYRSRESGTSEGVGIGLYLAREIITGQNGYIKVMSEKGKGSTFSVFLPIA